MEFKKVYDSFVCQVYYVKKPTSEYKKLYPKKYTFIYKNLGSDDVEIRNSNTIDIMFMRCLMYVFTTVNDNTFLKLMGKPETLENEIFASQRGDMINHFTSEYDVVMSIDTLPQFEYPPNMYSDQIIQCKYSVIHKLSESELKKTVNDTIKLLSETELSLISWIYELYRHFPTNIDGSIRRFHNSLTNNTINNITLKPFTLSIGYDMRVDDNIKELSMTKLIEDTFVPNIKITLYETFNHDITSIKKHLDKNNIKYTDNDKHSVILTHKEYNKIGLNFQICDFV